MGELEDPDVVTRVETGPVATNANSASGEVVTYPGVSTTSAGEGAKADEGAKKAPASTGKTRGKKKIHKHDKSKAESKKKGKGKRSKKKKRPTPTYHYRFGKRKLKTTDANITGVQPRRRPGQVALREIRCAITIVFALCA